MDLHLGTAHITRRQLLRLLSAGIVVCTSSACGSPTEPATRSTTAPAPGASPASETPPANAVTPRRLRIGTSFAISNASPLDNGFWFVAYGVAQTLFRVSPDDSPLPWIATGIERSDDTVYDLKLDPGARFHSGRPINAAAVQAALEQHLAYDPSAVPSLVEARFEIPDSQTLRITTSRPDPWLMHYLAQQYLPMFDVAEVPDQSDPTTIGNGLYSGPFRVQSLDERQLTLDPVSDAWDGTPRLDGVDVQFVQDAQARLSALRSDEIDLMLFIPTAAVPTITAIDGLQIKQTSGPTRVWVQLNHDRPPLDDVAVRQAIALGIDRRQLAEQVLNGLYEAVDSIYPSSMPWSVPNVLRTDQAEAQRLLETAGWERADNGIYAKNGQPLSFEWLYYPQQPDTQPISEAIQAQLKTIGIDIRLKQVDDIVAAYTSKEFDAGLTYLAVQLAGNPMAVLNTHFKTGAPRNDGSWGSAELDELIDQLNREFDTEQRTRLLRQVQELFARDVPVTFAVGYPPAVVVNEAFATYEPPHHVHTYIVTHDTVAAL